MPSIRRGARARKALAPLPAPIPLLTPMMRGVLAGRALAAIEEEIDIYRPSPERLEELLPVVVEARAALTNPGAFRMEGFSTAWGACQTLAFLFAQWTPPPANLVDLAKERKKRRAR